MPENRILTVILMTAVLAGCAGTRLKLHDWTKLPDEQYTIPPYARYLAQYKIALDPGHGGNARLPGYKRGPTGLREAEVNLRVARFLREFLEKAGATVILTREDDRFVSLQDRADLAAAAGCDFMISLHHNSGQNPETNFVTVFYHLNPDFSPVSMDLARHVYFGLVDALRLPQLIEDGLRTDQLVYPSGFGLLRRATIPAILLESSFYSNRKEEKRLSNWRYNRREAYGIFLGLARWAAGGVPHAQRVAPAGVSRQKRPELRYRLFDGITERGGRDTGQQLIFAGSVRARVDGRSAPVQLSPDRAFASFAPDSALSNGLHLIRVDLENLYKNHNFPRTDTLIVAAPTDSIALIAAHTVLPADTSALLPVKIRFLDRDGEPVWDGTEVRVRASRGEVAPELPKLVQGEATVYYKSAADTGRVAVVAAADSHADTLFLRLLSPGQVWTLGGAVLDDSTQKPLAGAAVFLNDSLRATSDDNGFYFIFDPPPGSVSFEAKRRGYASERLRLTIDSTRSRILNVALRANLGGVLHEQVVILDAALDDSSTGYVFADTLTAAAANLALARHLDDTRAWAGATAVLVRDDEPALAVPARIRKVNALPEGWYLKLGYRGWEKDSLLVQATIYPANQMGEEIARAILTSFQELPNVRVELLQNTEVPEVTLTNKTAVQLLITCRRPEVVRRDMPRVFAGIVAFQKRAAAEARVK
ncbi:MAG: hypothetical protein D6743_05495 [Calditrichaeota bacterium]|nr:MAG: hypothetical protein D6743_05495 [Calditrichota bacterium]